jgi:hypothetical protein
MVITGVFEVGLALIMRAIDGLTECSGIEPYFGGKEA